MKMIIMTMALTVLAVAGTTFANEAAAACYGKKCDYVADLIQGRESDRRGIALPRRANPWEIQSRARRDGVLISPDEASNIADYMNRPQRHLPRYGNRYQRQVEADRVLRGEYNRR